MSEKKKPTPEERRLRKALVDLTAAVLVHLANLDVLMRRPSTVERGRAIAEVCNLLALADDGARYFTLGIDYRTDKEAGPVGVFLIRDDEHPGLWVIRGRRRRMRAGDRGAVATVARRRWREAATDFGRPRAAAIASPKWTPQSWNTCPKCKHPVEKAGGDVEFCDGDEARCIECKTVFMVTIFPDGTGSLREPDAELHVFDVYVRRMGQREGPRLLLRPHTRDFAQPLKATRRQGSMSLPINPTLPTLSLPCRPWGLPATLVLVLDAEELGAGMGLLWAFWRWPTGDADATIGRA